MLHAVVPIGADAAPMPEAAGLVTSLNSFDGLEVILQTITGIRIWLSRNLNPQFARDAELLNLDDPSALLCLLSYPNVSDFQIGDLDLDSFDCWRAT
jgi:hypothetical protein